MSDHAQTLRDEAAAILAEFEKFHRATVECMETGHVPHYAKDWAALLPALARRHAACLSGADALVRDKQTCGNCAFWEPAWPAINPNRGVCQNHKAAACDSEIAADDACRKGWATRED